MSDAIVKEKYEWCNLWWNNADETHLPRVLLIGDSISIGYRPTVIELLKDKVNVDNLATSRSINDPALKRELVHVLTECPYVVIHFNNGLHGGHLSLEAYEAGLRKMVSLVLQYAPAAKLIWARSTPILDEKAIELLKEEANPKVIARNEVADKVMKDLHIPVNDLYSLVFGKVDWYVQDGIHYTPEGQENQGKAVAGKISAFL